MFLSAAGGDLDFARRAATETLQAYRTETHADLLTLAKIIAFGLATLGSLTLSMADDLPVTQVLRLRASANATDRSEHRNRLVLKQPGPQSHQAPQPPEPVIDQAALAAAAAEMQQRTAENLARFSQPTPAPTLSDEDEEKHYQATWAASAATIAAETAAALPNLPPEERASAAMWIDVLNDAAKAFMAGDIPPRPRPGDLGAIMRGG